MAQESQIVQAVFPNPPLVMQVFLQRVFAQSVRVCGPCLKSSQRFADSAIHGTVAY